MLDPRERPDELRRLAGVAGSPEDGAMVLAKNIEPCADIVGMPDGRDDAERRAQEGAGHLCDQLLARIEFAAVPTRQIARQPRLMAGPMAKLVKAGPVVIDLVEEGRLRRDLDIVRQRDVTGPLAADPEIRVG